jgi:hypothetical protein
MEISSFAIPRNNEFYLRKTACSTAIIHAEEYSLFIPLTNKRVTFKGFLKHIAFY